MKISLLIVFLYIILPLCCLIGLRRVSPVSRELDKNSSLELRGVGMLMIVLTHATNGAPGNVAFFWSVTGIVGVAICFFLSGYGLYKSWKRKDDYLQYFLPQKIARLLLPYMVIYSLYLICCLLLNEKKTLTRILFELVTLQMGSSPLWYIKIQLLLYILFFVSFYFFRQEDVKVIMLALLAIIYYFMAKVYGMPDYWYNTCLFFPLGVFLSYHEKTVFSVLTGRVVQLISLSALIFTYCVVYFRGWIIPILVDGAYMMTFIICLIGVASHFTGSKCLKMLGRYSMEVYLIHLLLLSNRAFGLFYPENVISYILLFIVTLLLAVPVNKICNNYLMQSLQRSPIYKRERERKR